VRPPDGSEEMAMQMYEYLDRQKQEALGPVNKWYCSQHYGCEISDPERLLSYYIKHGGASNFRQEHVAEVAEPAESKPR
jgi:hypothetical protein